MGSLDELETQLLLAERLKYLGKREFEATLARADELGNASRNAEGAAGKNLNSKL
jgi:hypothetical protein